MVASRDIALSIFGFIISIYGSLQNDLTVVIAGIIFVFIGIMLSIQEQENDIGNLKTQINTQLELKKILIRLDKIENKDNKPKKSKR